MKKKTRKSTNILDTEMFGDDHRHYYFDIKQAKNKKHYLRITNRRQESDATFKRTQIIFFEDDLPLFVEAISMLLGRHAAGKLGVSC